MNTVEDRLQAALLAKRRRSLAERADAAWALIREGAIAGVVIVLILAVAFLTGAPHDHS